MLGSCFRCIVIENSKAIDIENVICSYFWERNFEYDNTCREIDLLIKQLDGRDEYTVTAANIDDMFAEMAEKGGGVLFFDEIYTLAEDNATVFDKEAVTCIVQNMENYRNSVFCIFAGYEDKMNDFLGSNPGLRSRISFIVRFSGYSDDVLCDIFTRMAAEDNYKIPADSEASVISFFKRLRAARGEQFGNGREARNLYINAKQHHALKIGGFKTKTKKMLTRLDPDDISAAAADILKSELKVSQGIGSIGFL